MIPEGYMFVSIYVKDIMQVGQTFAMVFIVLSSFIYKEACAKFVIV